MAKSSQREHFDVSTHQLLIYILLAQLLVVFLNETRYCGIQNRNKTRRPALPMSHLQQRLVWNYVYGLQCYDIAHILYTRMPQCHSQDIHEMPLHA